MAESKTLSTKEPIWTTKDKRKIPLSQLETTHIANIIPWLERAKERKFANVQAAFDFLGIDREEASAFIREIASGRIMGEALAFKEAADWWIKKLKTELERRTIEGNAQTRSIQDANGDPNQGSDREVQRRLRPAGHSPRLLRGTS